MQKVYKDIHKKKFFKLYNVNVLIGTLQIQGLHSYFHHLVYNLKKWGYIDMICRKQQRVRS